MALKQSCPSPASPPSLADGTVSLRRLHTGDEPTLRRFFYSHSKDTVLLRYGYPLHTMSENRAHRLVNVDERKGVAIGIFSRQTGKESLWAVGRYSIEGANRAEISFVVHEDHRRCGLATALLRELARIAGEHGIKRFRAQVLRENFAMRRLFSRFNPRFEDDTISRELEYFLEVAIL